MKVFEWQALREKCPYSELLWSAFSRIGSVSLSLSLSLSSVQMRENTDQNHSEYEPFLRSEVEVVSA